MLARYNPFPVWRLLIRYLLSREADAEWYCDWPVGEVVTQSDADLDDPAEFAIVRNRNPHAKAIVVRKAGVVVFGAALRVDVADVIKLHDIAWRTPRTPGLEHLANRQVRACIICRSATRAAYIEAEQCDVEIVTYRPHGWRDEDAKRLRLRLQSDESRQQPAT